MSPEQMRKKEAAQQEAERHARYAQADGSMKSPEKNPPNSAAIAAAGRRVNAATAKEDATIGGKNASINDERY
jgi:hypothetical protein